MFYPAVGQPREQFFKVRDGLARRAHCSACGAEARPKRGRLAEPRCPNRIYDWHTTAQAIAQEMEQTEKPQIKELLLDDLVRFLGEHGVMYGGKSNRPHPQSLSKFGEGCRDQRDNKQTQAAGDGNDKQVLRKLSSYEHVLKAPEDYIVLALPDSKFEHVIMKRSDLGDVLVDDLETYALVARELIRAGVEVINYAHYLELRSRVGNRDTQT